MRSLITLILCLTFAGSAFAAQEAEHTATPSGQAVPRFVSLKVDVANGRSGPSSQHPIAWRYLRAGLPMEVIAETPDWRRVRDPEGEVTWMHRSILSGRRSVYTLEETTLHARDSDSSPIEAVAEAGVILSLERCRTGWCRVEGQGFRGWVRPHTLWGVYQQELDTGTGDETDGNPALSRPVAHDTALP